MEHDKRDGGFPGGLTRVFPVRERAAMLENLKRNWYVPLSAAALFFLQAVSHGIVVSIAVSFVLIAAAVTQVRSVWKTAWTGPLWLRALSALTAAGICWESQAFFFQHNNGANIVTDLGGSGLLLFVSIFGAAAAFPAACLWSCYLFAAVWGRLCRYGLFSGMSRKEKAVYGVLLAGTLLAMALIFTRTQAFYGTNRSYDIVYTSDSPELVQQRVYVSLYHVENDLRQPLFAVFAAPFSGAAYLMSRCLGLSLTGESILVNAEQIVLLMLGNCLLAGAAGLSPAGRMSFMLAACCGYTYMLFSLMMEQYVVAFFWLIVFFSFAAKEDESPLFLWAAGGTLLTSLAAAVALPGPAPWRDGRHWLGKMVFAAAGFLFLFLAFARFDVIQGLFANVNKLAGFAGGKVPFWDRVLQYLSFVRGCFFAADAGFGLIDGTFAAWRTHPVTEVSICGAVILLGAAAGFAVSRKDKFSQYAGGWAVMSAVMLCGIGWGTSENGLILYSLYFGWAFYVLWYRLLTWVGTRARIRWLAPAAACASAAAMLAVNIPVMGKLLYFAENFYPL